MTTLNFLPYSRKELESIINQIFTQNSKKPDFKVKTFKNKKSIKISESQSYSIDPKASEFISKKFEKNGDLREMFKYMRELLKRTSNIKVSDCIEKRIEYIPEQSIHHKLVRESIEKENGKTNIYRRYLQECKGMRIRPFDRTDFNIIYEDNI